MRFNLFKNSYWPIGVELRPESVGMAQLAVDAGQVKLIAGGTEPLQSGLVPYSGRWQRSAIEAVKTIYASANFKSRNVVTTVLCNEIFIREIKISADTDKTDLSIADEIKDVIPFQAEGALIKSITLDKDSDGDTGGKNAVNTLVMATEKTTVEKHLAIFEKASLNVKTVTVWPMVLVSSYVSFFGRRQCDADKNVMLVNVGKDYCNVVICRQNNILFARTITKGTSSLDTEKSCEGLIFEIEACIRFFQNERNNAVLNQIILLGNEGIDKKFRDCVLAVAKEQSLPASIGDVLKAVSGQNNYKKGIDARDSKIDWTTTFGLSLTGR